MAEQKRLGLIWHAVMSFIFGILLYFPLIFSFSGYGALLLFFGAFSFLFMLGAIIPGFYVLRRVKQSTPLATTLAAIGLILGLISLFSILF